MIDPASLPRRAFTCATTVRLISTAYIDEPALTPLADSDSERAVLEELEGLTSARRTTKISRPAGIAQEELVTPAQGYGWTHINAAFCYTRAGGNRFNGADRGAWYASYGETAVPTAQAEVAYHLTRELDATGVYENVTAYRELFAGITTEFHDLGGHEGEDCLSPDPEVGYPAGQALARALLAAGGNGLLYGSRRLAGGHCLAAFRPHLVQNLRQGDRWVFRWQGGREPEILKD